MRILFVIVMSAAVEYLFVTGTGRIVGARMSLFRSLAAAMLGGLFNGYCLLRTEGSGVSEFAKLCSVVPMAVIAFGWKRSTLTAGGFLIILQLAMIGSLHILPGWGVLVPAALGIGAAALYTYYPKKKYSQKKFSDVRIRYMDNTVEIKAFRDTGNCLKDPVTGEGVIVLGPEAAFRLTGLTPDDLNNPCETLISRKIKGLRLLSYSAAGNKEALMLGIRFRDSSVDGIPGSIVAGLASGGLGKYDALIGGCDGC